MNNHSILLRHNYIDIPKFVGTSDVSQASSEAIVTVLMSLSYYGKALSVEAYNTLRKMTGNGLAKWYVEVEHELKEITGDNRKIGDFVVYKNFPAEVLNKSEAEYWLPQILMYWGFPKELFTEEVEPREKMDKQPKCTVLKLSKANTLKDILSSHLKSPARWKAEEFDEVVFLSDTLPINFAKLSFKENLTKLAAFMMTSGRKVNINTATDVLRLSAGLSGGDVSLRERCKFKSFKKPERRFLLGILEGCDNLDEDVARRPELFKRLFHQLHPGDYKRAYPKVCHVYDDLYHDRLETFNSTVEQLLGSCDAKVLKVLALRPGDFRRRLVHTIDLFGDKAVKAFVAGDVLPKLTTAQIVSLRSYIETANHRVHRTFPPKGNWTKMQIGDVRPIDEKHVKSLSKALGHALSERIPTVKVLDEATKLIKLPSNDGEVSPYNRGTVFPIPDDVEFIRTASYWQNTSGGVTWFDNGWNFFDDSWKQLGACCWNAVKFPEDSYRHYSAKRKLSDEVGAVFSGDPINTGEMKGRAAQLIDLYPKKLLKRGVRYAVWNILCYSRLAFSEVEDVFAALQWGTDPQKGNLFEPSRCQLMFPLKGNSMTKYVCVLDLETRQMIYIDANLAGNTSSATSNGDKLEKNLPPFMEYIRSLPSVHDLFRESVDKKGNGAYILYSDADAKLSGESAYVFKQENKDSKYKALDLNSFLT